MSVDELGLVGTTEGELRFEACVDAGGFGLVYRALDTRRNVPVAVKCMRIPYGTRSNPGMVVFVESRFRDEAKLLAKLSSGHPDIVKCHGSGTLVAPETGERTPYMVLDWLDGRTLSRELNERRERGTPSFELGAALDLLESAASALAHAHAHDVVHRDVKPANVFLARQADGTERAKMLDFGIAKILADDILGMKPSVETAMGTQFCSPSYGAPEQFTPTAGQIGPWTDVYALALIVLELLLGKRARPASSLAEGAIRALDPMRGSPRASGLGLSLPAAVEDVLARAVAQDTRVRPRDAGVFWAELREAHRAATSSPKAGFGATLMMSAGNAPLARPTPAKALERTLAMSTPSPLAGPPSPRASPPMPAPAPASPPMPAPAPASFPGAGRPIAASAFRVETPPPRTTATWELALLVGLGGALVGAALLVVLLWAAKR